MLCILNTSTEEVSVGSRENVFKTQVYQVQYTDPSSEDCIEYCTSAKYLLVSRVGGWFFP